MDLHQWSRNSYYSDDIVDGDSYSTLLNLTLQYKCDSFEFSIRRDIDFQGDGQYSYSKKTHQLIRDLSEHLISKKESNSWSTDSIISREIVATVYQYSFNPKSAAVILSYSSKLNDWYGPNLPEDITFFQEGKIWLATIGHEAMSWWFLTDNEYKVIKNLGINFINE